MGHGFSGILIEPGSKTGEGLEFFELGVGQLQIARNGPESRELGLTSDPGDRFPHINGGKHPKLEKGRGEVNLSVRYGDEVRGDIGRYVLGIRRDDREGGE